MITIQLHNLSIGYRGKHHTYPVATGLNASLHSGRLTCLLGANGVGKSTLLRTLSAFLPPLEGSITLLNKPLEQYADKELARALSVVLTERIDVPDLRVTDVVALGRTPYTGFLGGLNDTDEERVRSALQATGITHLAQRKLHTLSDGERQKCMIAKALAQDTPLIFLDEPTAFLDYPSKVDMMLLLRRLARDERKAVLLSTHDLELALQTADRLWLLSPTAELEGEAGASHGANPSMHSSNLSSYSVASSFPAPATLVGGTPRALADGGQIASFVNRDSMVFDADTMSVRLKPMP